MFYICNVQHSSWQPEVTTEPWNAAAGTKEWDSAFYLILINTNCKSHMFSGDHTERCRFRLSYENATTVSVCHYRWWHLIYFISDSLNSLIMSQQRSASSTKPRKVSIRHLNSSFPQNGKLVLLLVISLVPYGVCNEKRRTYTTMWSVLTNMAQ